MKLEEKKQDKSWDETRRNYKKNRRNENITEETIIKQKKQDENRKNKNKTDKRKIKQKKKE